MRGTLAVVISAIVAMFITHLMAAPKERHHLYWCVHPDSGIALPCMYRKNDPVSV